MTHDIDSIRKQIATLTAALDALEGKALDPLQPTQAWFNAMVEFEIGPRNSDSANFETGYFNASGMILVDLDLLNWSKDKNGTIMIHAWDDDDLIKIVRDQHPWLPGDAKVVDWSFEMNDDEFDLVLT